MLIRTQSGEALAQITYAYLSEMMGESDYYIFGICSGHGVFSRGKITLGIYKSKEKAQKELDDMTEFFEKNPIGLYRMK